MRSLNALFSSDLLGYAIEATTLQIAVMGVVCI
jgi:hypothetical protein